MSDNHSEALVIERLTRVEEKIDNVLDKVGITHSRIEDHESRLRVLELSGAKLLGIGAAIAALSGIAGSRLVEIFVGS